MVYNITGDEKYAKRCKEEMTAVIDLTPIWTTEQDLDMGEMAAAFGIGYD